MASKMLGTLTTLIVYLAAATLFAEIIVLWRLWDVWGMDQDRLAKITAIAMGVDVDEEERIREQFEDKAAKEVMINDVVERRALASRELEAREQAVKMAFDNVKFQQGRLEEAQENFWAVVDNFEKKMQDIEEGARKEGLAELTGILQSLKAPQAKDQIMIMLENKEVDTVVQVLRSMEERPRSKIIAEMEGEPETEELAEVLWLIREGEPRASLADGALNDLNDQVPRGLPPQDETGP